MKKSYLLFLFIVLLDTACKKGSNNNPSSAQTTLVGKWITKKIITTTYNNNSTSATKTDVNTTFYNSDWINFNSNGTYTSSGEPGGGTSGTYTIDATGKSITIVNSANTRTGTIRTLSNSSLVIYNEVTIGTTKTGEEDSFSK